MQMIQQDLAVCFLIKHLSRQNISSLLILIMIQRLLKFSIRKDIPRKNKPINHKALVQTLTVGEKIPYLAKWHKKKLIAFGLVLIIVYTYDLQKPIYRKIMSLRSPVRFLQSFFVHEPVVPNTILEQEYRGLGLENKTIDLLEKLYYTADKQLYFGVGRNILFQVYEDLHLIEKEDEIKKFWTASGFYKERNQRASGVGAVEFYQIFDQALTHARKKDPNLSEQDFLKTFASKFIEKLPEIQKWEVKFNAERMGEFIKNTPGDNLKKQDAIIDILKDASRDSEQLLTLEEMEEQIQAMGLRGMNISDKLLFWDITKTWHMVKLHAIHRKLGHPLTTESEKGELILRRDELERVNEGIDQNITELEEQFQTLYKESAF